MRKLVLAAVLVLMASEAQAATLNVVNGQLMGASDVLVDGSYYDVQFLDGTCVDLYNGCDDLSDLTFSTNAAVVLAAYALIDQVFLEAVSDLTGLPVSVNGCDPLSGPCVTYTPSGRSFADFQLEDPPRVDVLCVNDATTGSTAWFIPSCGPYAVSTAYDSSQSGSVNYAVWTLVPEPSTALLLGLGLAGMASYRRL